MAFVLFNHLIVKIIETDRVVHAGHQKELRIGCKFAVRDPLVAPRVSDKGPKTLAFQEVPNPHKTIIGAGTYQGIVIRDINRSYRLRVG
jgi:hypothetical protein